MNTLSRAFGDCKFKKVERNLPLERRSLSSEPETTEFIMRDGACAVRVWCLCVFVDTARDENSARARLWLLTAGPLCAVYRFRSSVLHLCPVCFLFLHLAPFSLVDPLPVYFVFRVFSRFLFP